MDTGESYFGKYRILQQLASGGMAHLLLASIDGPDGFSKPCVVKRILPEYANLEAFSRMFADEAKVAALLTHPNIVQVFDFGKIDGQYYLAMEWIQGQSLDRVLRHAWKGAFPLGPRVAVDVGLAISDALAYAHAKTLPDGTPLKLVHRDVTPGNVLVSRDGIVKLADFGIVKSSVNLERTVTGVVKGKYPYMSPEQITNRELDHRSDLYSLGIVLYEASTGKRLYKRDTVEATIMAASQAHVPPPSEHNPDFPPGLERILLKLLQREPDARYQSARELHVDLEKFRASQNWTSGGRELAMLVTKLCPPDPSGQMPTALPAFGSASTRTPSGAPGVKPHESSGLSRLTPSGTLPTQAQPPPTPGAAGFPWGIAVAAGVSALGTALFWYFAA
ncbi:serine/threonine protein kinase [Pyxidicoccus parkwayensis]|uniref:Serine/threonine protein kinase n=1 Tax=Pyxidicoccus parkwayensis TaxID=2813578 RepID=A0ABX7NWN0_9BACT|nr:serine/threonine-protein kinase [Pyxidicoccus parkwaysis]QSQ22836.1 serine/threonine protein kinase [Pyxidicoccus parkwaysis]